MILLMLSAPALSAALGAALGAANAVASLVLYHRARTRGSVVFAQLVLGGMLVRMATVLGVLVLVLVFTSVARGPFVMGLLAAFVLGLIIEASIIQKQRPLPPEG
ncbi:hypothetical protein BH23BAC4_BH23BAC4_12110 [soil metagenome]